MIIVGVDPGKKGAIAAMLDGNDELVIVDMPADLAGLVDVFTRVLWVDPICVIEQQWPRPEAGAWSANKLGHNVGQIEGVAAALGYTVVSVSPQRWKKDMGLTKAQIPEGVRPKDASRAKAAELWPDHADLFKRVKDDGRAESALIALWFQRHGKEA